MKGFNFLRPGQMIDSSSSDNKRITPPPKTTIYVTFLQLVGLFVINLGVQAEPIYRWQDAEGVPHFSDRPRSEGYSDRLTPAKSFSDLARQPPTSNRLTNDIATSRAENLNDQPSNTMGPSQTTNPLPILPAAQLDRASTRGATTNQCTRAYRTLGALKRRPRATIRAKGGKLVTLTRQEKAAYIANLEEDIAAYCK